MLLHCAHCSIYNSLSIRDIESHYYMECNLQPKTLSGGYLWSNLPHIPCLDVASNPISTQIPCLEVASDLISPRYLVWRLSLIQSPPRYLVWRFPLIQSPPRYLIWGLPLIWSPPRYLVWMLPLIWSPPRYIVWMLLLNWSPTRYSFARGHVIRLWGTTFMEKKIHVYLNSLNNTQNNLTWMVTYWLSLVGSTGFSYGGLVEMELGYLWVLKSFCFWQVIVVIARIGGSKQGLQYIHLIMMQRVLILYMTIPWYLNGL